MERLDVQRKHGVRKAKDFDACRGDTTGHIIGMQIGREASGAAASPKKLTSLREMGRVNRSSSMSLFKGRQGDRVGTI